MDRLISSATTDLFGYYGIDLVAAVLIVLSVWRVGRGRRDGFLLGAASGVLWVVFGFMVPSLPIIVCNTGLAAVNLRSYARWRPEGTGAPVPTPQT